jgi:ferredoxin-NADP reductase
MSQAGWQSAIVRKVERRTDRVVSLFFDNVIGRYRPGQHVDVRLVAEDGYEARRSYSIASAPDAEQLELMIERLDDGEVSPFLHEIVRVGDTLDLLGPIGGHFVWTREVGSPLLLLAGGSGIAPLMSMLRYRTAEARDVSALLVYGVRVWADLVYRDELLAMQRDDANFSLIVATSREAATREGDVGGRLDRTSLKALLSHWPVASEVFVCGSTPFVETIAGALVEVGVDASKIRTERYGGIERPSVMA